MHRKDSDEDEVGLEVAYFELVAARPTMTLLRLGGRWSGVDAADLGPLTLVLGAEGQEHRLPALPEAQSTGESDDAPPWRAAFAAPLGAATARSATFRLDAGPVVALPQPVERRLGAEPAAPREPPSIPTAIEKAKPLSGRRIGPRLIAVAVLVVVALLIIVAVATSGTDPRARDGARGPVALMDVLPTGGGASGEVVRGGDGGLVLRLRGLQGRRSGVWLLDSVVDARLVRIVEGPAASIPLPPVAEVRRFRYLDVSRKDDANANHSGLSVLRVATGSVR
jgi:hypothetical protein